MGKPNYNFKPQVESKCAKARGSDLRCHFKNLFGNKKEKMAFNWKRCCGICSIVTGVVLLLLAFLFWTILNAVVLTTLKDLNFITSPESDLYPDWECSYRAGQEPMDAWELFYVFNITNPEEVLAGGIPYYDERGPFTYRANYTKFNIEFMENDVIQYKRCKTFYLELERSSGPDTERVININPGYLGAVYATGGETVLIIILTGPAIEYMISQIEIYYINGTLLQQNTFEFWLARCQSIDPNCLTTNDMATVQWGFYNSSYVGINNEEMNELLPEYFPEPDAEYSSNCYNTFACRVGANVAMSIEDTHKLLYGEVGIVADPANFELLALTINNQTGYSFEDWGLDDGRASTFLRYSLAGILNTYTRSFLVDIIIGERGSGFLRWRTVWEILWEEIEPLLVVLQPWNPYANIFFNYTSTEQADQLTGNWRINNGETDTDLVEEMLMWENYEIVDVFWTNYNVPVSGNSGNGQFIPAKLSFSGKPPEEFPEFYAWSPDHGKAVLFKDSMKKVELFNVTTHLMVMVNETYNLDSKYDLTDPLYLGFVNATRINDDVPIFYSQPRMLLVNQFWLDRAPGQPPASNDVDNTYIWIEPITGLALAAEVKLQVNFYVPNKTEMLLFDEIYTEVMDQIMYPLTWTQQSAMLKEQDAIDLEDQLFSLLDLCDIIWIVMWVVGPLWILSGIYLVRTAPKAGYEPIN